MDCTALPIKELLPAYREGSLGPDDRTLVELHLAACPDCAGELALLRTVADDPVPDPGEAFWTSLPERIHREIRIQQRSEPRPRSRELLLGIAAPRWGWATAAVFIIAVVALLMLRPVHHRSPATEAKHQTAAPQDIITEALNGTDIRPGDLDQLSSWARQELLALQSGLADASFSGNGAVTAGLDLEDELAALSEEELDQLIDALSRIDEEDSV